MRAFCCALLLVVLLAGCQSTTVEQDPGERLLPEGTVSTIHTALAPEFVPYARTISVWHLEWLPNLTVPASGAYIPFTRTIIVSAESSDPDVTLIHEVLHVVAWKGMIPHMDQFEASVEKFLEDKRYEELVKYAREKWKSYEESWLYPNFMRLDEYYAYIGSILLERKKYGDTGLPEYLAQHYRGILHPLLYFDHRFYGKRTVPDWDVVTAVYWHQNRVLMLTAKWVEVEALFRYGGVLRPYLRAGMSEFVAIERIYDTQTQQPFDVSIPPNCAPTQITIPVTIRGEDRATLSRESYLLLMGTDTRTGDQIFSQEILNPKRGQRKHIHVSMEQALRLLDAYTASKLEVTLVPQTVAQNDRGR